MSGEPETEAVETAAPAPAQPAAAAVDLEDETLASAAKALASGHLSPEDVKRGWQLSDAELAAISKPAPIRQSVAKIDEELRQVDARRRENAPAYRKDQRLQERELALIGEREKLANGTSAIPEDVLESWRNEGGVEHHVEIARNTATTALDELQEDDAAELVQTFEALPQDLQSDIYRFIAVEPSDRWRPASDAHVKAVAAVDPELIKEWGASAPQKLGALRGRLQMMLQGASPEKRAAAEAFVDGMPPAQFRAIAKALVGP